MDWQVIVKNMASTDLVARDKIIMTLGPRITKWRKDLKQPQELGGQCKSGNHTGWAADPLAFLNLTVLRYLLFLCAFSGFQPTSVCADSFSLCQWAVLHHRAMFTSCCIPRALEQQAGVWAADPQCWKWAAALAPVAVLQDWSWEAVASPFLGMAFRVSVWCKVSQVEAMSFGNTLFLLCCFILAFSGFSCHLCCMCKEQIASRDVRWGRATPCSRRGTCWWWLTAINCSPRGYVLYLTGQNIICIENLDVHLVNTVFELFTMGLIRQNPGRKFWEILWSKALLLFVYETVVSLSWDALPDLLCK